MRAYFIATLMSRLAGEGKGNGSRGRLAGNICNPYLLPLLLLQLPFCCTKRQSLVRRMWHAGCGAVCGSLCLLPLAALTSWLLEQQLIAGRPRRGRQQQEQQEQEGNEHDDTCECRANTLKTIY